MKSRLTVCLSAVVVVLSAGLLWLWNGKSASSERGEVDRVAHNVEVGSEKAMEVESSSRSKAADDVASTAIEGLVDGRDNSDVYVNMERISRDEEYSKRIRRHAAIKSYLNSTRRNDPEYQELLQKLVAKGFNIEHWQPVASVILFRRAFELNEVKTMRLEGFSDEEIEQRVTDLPTKFTSTYSQFNQQLGDILGSSDADFLEELMSIPLGFEEHEYIFGRPGFKLVDEGEKILGEDDWLTGGLRELQTVNSLNP